MDLVGWITQKVSPSQDKASQFLHVGDPAPAKTGEQSGAMSDPQGKRVYHEYFVGEDRGDGHFPWAARVYTGGVLHSEKQGLATTHTVARQQADNWGLAVKAQILGAP